MTRSASTGEGASSDSQGSRLSGRVAVVTGASRGLGRAIAEAFASEGAAVAIAARTGARGEDVLPGSLAETVAAIKDAGGVAIPVVCDVTDDEDLQRLIATAQSELGPVDLLVNNAAATVPGRPGQRPQTSAGLSAVPGVLEVPLRAVRKQFEVNLFSVWRLIQLVLPGMLAAGSGTILSIGSEGARMPGPPAAYGASKLALEHLSASVARELPPGITIGVLLPSRPIQTPGMAWVGGQAGADDDASAAEFAEAAVRLAAFPQQFRDKVVIYSDDVLHPELGERRWLGDGSA